MANFRTQPIVAIEEFDGEVGVLDRRRLEEDEQAPLLEDEEFGTSASAFKEVDTSQLPWHKRPSIYWLLVPFALSALAFGGVMVPKVNLVLGLICNDYYRERPVEQSSVLMFEVEDKCRTPEVQARVATFKLLMGLISGGLAAVVSPRLGALSDRYGRTPTISFAISGMIINEIITIFAALFPETVSVYWILAGSIFDGLCGSFTSAMAIAHSYASDCTPSDRRNVVFAYFHGCLFTGIAIGPVLAGYIVKVTGDFISMFYIACGSHVVFVLFLLFVIPESVPLARQIAAREKYQWRNRGHSRTWSGRLWTLNVFEPLKIIYGPTLAPDIRRNLILLAATDTIVFGVGMGAHTVILLYSNYTFGWSNWEQSKFASIVNSCRVACLLIVLPLLTRWYRKRQTRKLAGRPASPLDQSMPEGTDIFELSIIRFAIAADILGYLGYALAPSATEFILAGAVASLGGMSSPTMQAALTKHVPKESVGQLLGAMALLHSAGRAIGPTIFTAIYAATVKFWPEAYFFVLAAMFGVGFAISWLVRPGDFRKLAPRLD